MSNWDLFLPACTNYRMNHGYICIRAEDRFSHIQILGKTGTGKTRFIENCIRQELTRDTSLIYIDPHGDSADALKQNLNNTESRVIYLDVSDPHSDIGINPLTEVPEP